MWDYLRLYDLNNNTIDYYTETLEGNTIVCFSGNSGIYGINNMVSINIIGILLTVGKKPTVQEFIVNSDNVKKKFTIDDKPLTNDESRIFIAGIESLIDMIRRLRKDSEKETNE